MYGKVNKQPRIAELKKDYEAAEIPQELPQLTKETILRAARERSLETKAGPAAPLSKAESAVQEIPGEKSKSKASRRRHMLRSLTITAAAFAVVVGVFAYSVNTNEAFAQSLKDVPILGTLADVFTGSVIHETNNVVRVNAMIPEVRGLEDKKLQAEINKTVKAKTTAAVKETKEIMAEAKEAWLETGGSEKDYMPMEINVTYDVKCITDEYLSFDVSKTETLASAYFEMDYYNYDLKTSKELTLPEMLQRVLGDNNMEKASAQIAAAIKERSKDEGALYWDGSDGIEGFKSLSGKECFYINKAGNPVVVFNKYEIAPGYMGFQEFEITK